MSEMKKDAPLGVVTPNLAKLRQQVATDTEIEKAAREQADFARYLKALDGVEREPGELFGSATVMQDQDGVLVQAGEATVDIVKTKVKPDEDIER